MVFTILQSPLLFERFRIRFSNVATILYTSETHQIQSYETDTPLTRLVLPKNHT